MLQGMREIPSSALRRSLRLAGLATAYAGRAALGLGKCLCGRPAELVAAEMQARTAAQLFQTLGELKGGAMKLGQALSAMEAAMPAQMAGPYRDAPSSAFQLSNVQARHRHHPWGRRRQ